MRKYAIWDKKSPIIVPTGKVFTAEEWMQEHPVAALETIIVICSAGEINGGIFDTLGAMVHRAENRGCNFDDCVTAEEKLARIEQFENDTENTAREAAAETKAQTAFNEELSATSLASIAASLEFQNMMMLPDEEDV